jgi:transcriptional regulator with XRE-family HTH domain
MNEAIISHCIKIALAISGLTPADLAEKLGVSRQTAFQYQNGKCLKVNKLSDVAAACDLTYDQLVNLYKMKGGNFEITQ